MTPSVSHTCAQCGRELPDLSLATFAELVGRMKMTASGGFVVSPVNDRDTLQEPPDLAGLLYPDASVKSAD